MAHPIHFTQLNTHYFKQAVMAKNVNDAMKIQGSLWTNFLEKMQAAFYNLFGCKTDRQKALREVFQNLQEDTQLKTQLHEKLKNPCNGLTFSLKCDTSQSPLIAAHLSVDDCVFWQGTVSRADFTRVGLSYYDKASQRCAQFPVARLPGEDVERQWHANAVLTLNGDKWELVGLEEE